MFLFIVLGIFLLFSLKGSPHPSPTVGVFADRRGGDVLQWPGGGAARTSQSRRARAEIWSMQRDGSRRHRDRPGEDSDHFHGSRSFTDGGQRALMGMAILVKYVETYDGLAGLFFFFFLKQP